MIVYGRVVIHDTHTCAVRVMVLCLSAPHTIFWVTVLCLSVPHAIFWVTVLCLSAPHTIFWVTVLCLSVPHAIFWVTVLCLSAPHAIFWVTVLCQSDPHAIFWRLLSRTPSSNPSGPQKVHSLANAKTASSLGSRDHHQECWPNN